MLDSCLRFFSLYYFSWECCCKSFIVIIIGGNRSWVRHGVALCGLRQAGTGAALAVFFKEHVSPNGTSRFSFSVFWSMDFYVIWE